MTTISYLQAIRDAQLEEMRRNKRVFIMGEDVAWNMLGSTEGFVEEFGAERVRNTPITEAAFTGAAAGAAMVGMRPIVDLMLTSFLYCTMDQIISSLTVDHRGVDGAPAARFLAAVADRLQTPARLL